MLLAAEALNRTYQKYKEEDFKLHKLLDNPNVTA